MLHAHCERGPSRWLLARQDSREGGFASGDGDEVAAAVEPCGVFVGRVHHEAADSDLLADGSAGAPGVFDERPAETAPLGAGGDGETDEQDGREGSSSSETLKAEAA